jgi:imidazole glycerol-phosphate synthase subunit HisH
VTAGPLIAVLDYGIGNLRSAQKAFQHLGADARLTADPAVIADAAGVVLPGVGAFGACMAALHRTGLADQSLAAVASGRPFLGICVGMQLLYEHSEEDPGVEGLGALSGSVRRLPPGVKHPQMQWNTLQEHGPAEMLVGVDRPAWVYFVHSFAADPGPGVVATCDYGGEVVAGVEVGNVWAMQFHPEKSGRAGQQILGNFLARVAHDARPTPA